MGAQAVNLTMNLSSTIQEVLDPAVVPGASAADKRTVQHDSWNVDKTLIASSTPAPSRCLVLEITIDNTGQYEIDLSAAPTTGAPTAGEDLTGKRVLSFEFQTPAANAAAITICDQAASNKYALFGAGNAYSLLKNSKLAQLHESSLMPAVAGGAKIIRISGTEDDVLRVKLTFQ